jgi:hypothetical protein
MLFTFCGCVIVCVILLFPEKGWRERHIWVGTYQSAISWVDLGNLGATIFENSNWLAGPGWRSIGRSRLGLIFIFAHILLAAEGLGLVLTLVHLLSPRSEVNDSFF